jgi:hypothetical protein
LPVQLVSRPPGVSLVLRTIAEAFKTQP